MVGGKEQPAVEDFAHQSPLGTIELEGAHTGGIEKRGDEHDHEQG